ncbi:65-kDa microtubule-associated protein 6 isoform X1 [Gossypium australe]|uniref:65-kDa microtubule-associated protein 6 isoform X1 n=1 Tax=Gossypium australe TaxID=47621 RepID=A0A5B6WNJ9_9ROSI|nr:65-kDa microtubule-associated protein 6 isoform X1 [Gossypium australe]
MLFAIAEREKRRNHLKLAICSQNSVKRNNYKLVRRYMLTNGKYRQTWLNHSLVFYPVIGRRFWVC